MASMCDSLWPVGMVPTTFNACGSITVTELSSFGSRLLTAELVTGEAQHGQHRVAIHRL
jgi:hypothetical protein